MGSWTNGQWENKKVGEWVFHGLVSGSFLGGGLTQMIDYKADLISG